MQQIAVSVSLTEITCGICGGVYAIAENLRATRYEQGGFWHCPYCQGSWGYVTSENDKLKKQLAEERARKDRALADANVNRELRIKAENSLQRIKKRVNNGVCPCCHRTFKQLAAHMKSKHPGVKP